MPRWQSFAFVRRAAFKTKTPYFLFPKRNVLFPRKDVCQARKCNIPKVLVSFWV
jgi:hypothetical protein